MLGGLAAIAVALSSAGATGQTPPEPATSANEEAPPTSGAEGISDDPAAPAPAESDTEAPKQPAPQSPEARPAPPLDLPDDPEERLARARSAFNKTDYGILVPLLQPIDVDASLLKDPADLIAARELLGVGFYFIAQQSIDSVERTELIDAAREVFLRLLRSKPDHQLDQLIFPASVVELFESVREANSEELDAIVRSQNPSNGNGETQTLYIERESVRGVYWLNFMPFGIGQFQNGQVAKGTAIALLQGAALAVNIASYWSIVPLRNENGRFDCASGEQNCNYANALRWRRNAYIGLGAFAGIWVLGVIDSLVNFETERVRIRTLDAPPPELVNPDAGTDFRLPLGLSIQLDW